MHQSHLCFLLNLLQFWQSWGTLYSVSRGRALQGNIVWSVECMVWPQRYNEHYLEATFKKPEACGEPLTMTTGGERQRQRVWLLSQLSGVKDARLTLDYAAGIIGPSIYWKCSLDACNYRPKRWTTALRGRDGSAQIMTDIRRQCVTVSKRHQLSMGVTFVSQ